MDILDKDDSMNIEVLHRLSVVQCEARNESRTARRQSEASERAEAEKCLSPVSITWARALMP